MQLENIHRCIIRVSFDEKSIYENLPNLASNIIVKNTRLEKMMEVTFLESNFFEIKQINNPKQIVEIDSITEWNFHITPLQLGEFPITFIIAIILLDGKKEITFTESIDVTIEPVPGIMVFKKITDYQSGIESKQMQIIKKDELLRLLKHHKLVEVFNKLDSLDIPTLN